MRQSQSHTERVVTRRDRPSVSPWLLDDVAPTLSEIRKARSLVPAATP
jgi:hypothetical protein